LSFKPKTDDIRESSSIYLIGKLLNEGVRIQAYDPAASMNGKDLWNKILFAVEPYEALSVQMPWHL